MESVLKMLDGIGAETTEALERFLDDESMYLKYVKTFPEEPTMHTLKQNIEDADYESAKKSVHALKGIVINLGFTSLADAAIDMMEELRDDNINAALEAYCDVEKQYNVYCNLIKSWRDKGVV